MGWAMGSELAEKVYARIRKYIPDNEREAVARFFYEAFSFEDADAWNREDLIIMDADIQEDE